MYKSFYEGHALLGFPLFALFFFIAIFSIACVLVLRRRNTPRYEALAHLPLADDSDARPMSAPGERHV